MRIGNITTDDWAQLVTLILALVAVIVWANEMRPARRKLLMVPPIIACLFAALFYVYLIFSPQVTIQNATELSSARSLTDVIMWIVAALSMRFIRKHGAIL